MAMARSKLTLGEKEIVKRYIGNRLVWEKLDKVYGKTAYSIASRDSEIEFYLTKPTGLYGYEWNDKYPYKDLVKITIGRKLVGRPRFRLIEGSNYFIERIVITNDNSISAPEGSEVIMYFRK